ncbi:hypothetical protein [Virgibacillus pantothenticus]|uniref:hypothetical protein n=1 Tax=Virgibacillus pantothenticus TaxID=1473 RepID=UPI0009878FF4|nr:hypothetical protein [Virgibacillus pantothenticus]
MLENRRNFIQENYPILKIFFQEMPFHPEIKHSYWDFIVQPLQERLRSIIKKFQDAGQISKTPIEMALKLTIYVTVGFLLDEFLFNDSEESNMEERIDTTISFIVKGLS